MMQGTNMDETTEVVKQQDTTNDGNTQVVRQKVSTTSDRAQTLTARNAVYYILGVLETLLAFRLVLKLLGANPASGFVSMVYGITDVLLLPFTGIFRSASTEGIETASVLEPATIIAMIVYAVIGWGIAKLVTMKSAS
jgi:hypothetical protein